MFAVDNVCKNVFFLYLHLYVQCTLIKFENKSNRAKLIGFHFLRNRKLSSVSMKHFFDILKVITIE